MLVIFFLLYMEVYNSIFLDFRLIKSFFINRSYRVLYMGILHIKFKFETHIISTILSLE